MRKFNHFTTFAPVPFSKNTLAADINSTVQIPIAKSSYGIEMNTSWDVITLPNFTWRISISKNTSFDTIDALKNKTTVKMIDLSPGVSAVQMNWIPESILKVGISGKISPFIVSNLHKIKTIVMADLQAGATSDQINVLPDSIWRVSISDDTPTEPLSFLKASIKMVDLQRGTTTKHIESLSNTVTVVGISGDTPIEILPVLNSKKTITAVYLDRQTSIEHIKNLPDSIHEIYISENTTEEVIVALNPRKSIINVHKPITTQREYSTEKRKREDIKRYSLFSSSVFQNDARTFIEAMDDINSKKTKLISEFHCYETIGLLL